MTHTKNDKIQVVQVTSSKWYLQVVSFQQSSNVHKKCKIQVSTIYPKVHTFSSIRSIPFMEIDDKGGEIVQRYERYGERLYKQKRLYKGKR